MECNKEGCDKQCCSRINDFCSFIPAIVRDSIQIPELCSSYSHHSCAVLFCKAVLQGNFDSHKSKISEYGYIDCYWNTISFFLQRFGYLLSKHIQRRDLL